MTSQEVNQVQLLQQLSLASVNQFGVLSALAKTEAASLCLNFPLLRRRSWCDSEGGLEEVVLHEVYRDGAQEVISDEFEAVKEASYVSKQIQKAVGRAFNFNHSATYFYPD